MASFTVEQAIQRIKNPKNKEELADARIKKTRHDLHSETIVSTLDRRQGKLDFLVWVKKILVDDEVYKMFKTIFVPPYPTNDLVDQINKELLRGLDPVKFFINCDFSTDELEDDFIEYRKRIEDDAFWKTEGFDTYTESIDDVLIVDLPVILEGQEIPDRPEPYYYVLSLDRLIDIDNTKIIVPDPELRNFATFKTEYVAFVNQEVSNEEKIIAFLDDDFYRLFLKSRNEFTLLTEVPHDLGYCPAKSFWSTPLNSNTRIQRKGNITTSLSKLDWLLFYQVSKQMLDTYAAYPIYATFKKDCSYKDEKTGAECENGYLRYTNEADEVVSYQCPECAKGRRLGVGALLEVDPPIDSGDPNLMQNPVQIISPDVDSLQNIDAKLEKLEIDIFESSVGKGGEAIKDQALNERQVMSMFESKENVLMNIKMNFKIIREFALSTVARLRYGDNFLSCSVSPGRRSFLRDESEQITEYITSKGGGLPVHELQAQRDSIYETKYRDNPNMSERINILKQLEPFPDLSIGELFEKRNIVPAIITDAELILKLKFNNFIDRFERENLNLIQFGRAVDFRIKIDRIKETLQRYVQEELNTRENVRSINEPSIIDTSPEAGRSEGRNTGAEAQAN